MPRRLNSFFTGNRELRELAQEARQLAALERLYRETTPPALAAASRVIGLERRVLVIGADNNAVAAKLRHLTPRILQKAQESNIKVTGIRVKVQVSTPRQGRTRPAHALSNAGREEIASLAAKMHDSPLKRALLRLSKH